MFWMDLDCVIPCYPNFHHIQVHQNVQHIVCPQIYYSPAATSRTRRPRVVSWRNLMWGHGATNCLSICPLNCQRIEDQIDIDRLSNFLLWMAIMKLDGSLHFRQAHLILCPFSENVGGIWWLHRWGNGMQRGNGSRNSAPKWGCSGNVGIPSSKSYPLVI